MKRPAYRIIRIVVLCGLLFSLSGCAGDTDEGPTLAVIGRERITVDEFNERISNLPERHRALAEKRRRDYLEEYINDALLFQEARRQGIHQDPDVKKLVEEARKKIVIARFLQDNVDRKVVVPDEDVERYYGENTAMFRSPEIMRISHILTLSREEAERLLSLLLEGADFEALARAKSVDPTAQRGGDIGYFPKGQLMPEIEAACETLGIGEISDVVKTSLGYHIIKLTDRREPQLIPLERVERSIRERLYAERKQEIFNGILTDLRERTHIEIDEEVLSDRRMSKEAEKDETEF